MAARVDRPGPAREPTRSGSRSRTRRGGTATAAGSPATRSSAIDIALWDVKGKLLGTSRDDLLGGPVHDRLPAIASCHAHYEDIGAMVEEAQEWLAPGLKGVKVGFGKRGNARLGYDHDRDVAYMRAMREGSGPDAWLMIDCGWNVKWDVTDGRPARPGVRGVRPRLDRGAAGRLGSRGLREPALEDDDAHRLRREGMGRRGVRADPRDRHRRRRRHRPRSRRGDHRFRRAADRIEAARRQANAHAWSSAICSAASLAMSFSSPAFKLFELKPLRNPMQHDLVTEPFGHVDGWVYPPTGPGLGIEVDRGGRRPISKRARPRRGPAVTWDVGAGLDGRGVIVTGAAGGIGAAVARAFAAAGARVLAVDLDQDAVDRLVGEFEGAGHAAMGVDLRAADAPDQVIERAPPRRR